MANKWNVYVLNPKERKTNMLTEKDYCDKDLSATLIEMGFRGFGNFYYGKDSSKLKTTHQFLTPRTAKALNFTLAVSLYEAQKFLREEKKIDIFVRAGYLGKNRVRHYFAEVFTSKDVVILDNDREDYDTYEEALLEGIKEAVKLLKERK